MGVPFNGVKFEVAQFMGPNGEVIGDDLAWHAWVQERLLGSGNDLDLGDLRNPFG